MLSTWKSWLPIFSSFCGEGGTNLGHNVLEYRIPIAWHRICWCAYHTWNTIYELLRTHLAVVSIDYFVVNLIQQFPVPWYLTKEVRQYVYDLFTKEIDGVSAIQ